MVKLDFTSGLEAKTAADYGVYDVPEERDLYMHIPVTQDIALRHGWRNKRSHGNRLTIRKRKIQEEHEHGRPHSPRSQKSMENKPTKPNSHIIQMVRFAEMKCPRCGGKGTIPCKRSGGKGYFEAYLTGQTKECSVCGGSGEVTCPNCGGKGYVKE